MYHPPTRKICTSGPGGTVTLSNSATGVTYELWNGKDPTGITLQGSDGNEISFTGIMLEGEYSVYATGI